MDKTKGIAYCGLACAVCGENAECAGCRNDGCKDRDWCKNRLCCLEKGYKGCWECEDFGERCGMLKKPRIHAFAEFIRDNGEDTLLSCLEKNEAAGVRYHYAGELVGDYDKLETEEEIKAFIANGVAKN